MHKVIRAPETVRDIPVLEAVQKFLSFCAARNDSPHTIRCYNGSLLQLVLAIGHATPVSEIRRKQIRDYLFALNPELKRRTIKIKIAAIRSFFNWMKVERYIDINPSDGISGPRLHQDLPVFRLRQT
jgi:integrase/recombinase XerC